MTLGFGFCMTNALISYKVDLCGFLPTRGSRRGLHGLLNLFAFTCSLAGVGLMYASEGSPTLTEGLYPKYGSRYSQAHVIIGWGALIGTLLVSSFGMLKLAIKSTGANDGDVLPGAFMHGFFGQLVWVFGMINICIGSSEQIWGLPNGVIVMAALLIPTVLAMIYVVPTSVRAAPGQHADAPQAEIAAESLNPAASSSLLTPGTGK